MGQPEVLQLLKEIYPHYADVLMISVNLGITVSSIRSNINGLIDVKMIESKMFKCGKRYGQQTEFYRYKK